MATKRELERDIANVVSLISAAKEAEVRLRAEADRDPTRAAQLRREADSRRRDAEGLNSRLNGLRSHLKAL